MQRKKTQVWMMPKNSYEMRGLKAPDMGALNSALKVKQFINAT